jgi:hypothetical protein
MTLSSKQMSPKERLPKAPDQVSVFEGKQGDPAVKKMEKKVSVLID